MLFERSDKKQSTKHYLSSRVEYTDALGRSRVCLRKDLGTFVKQDQDLTTPSSSVKEKKPSASKTINLTPVIDVGPKFQVSLLSEYQKNVNSISIF